MRQHMEELEAEENNQLEARKAAVGTRKISVSLGYLVRYEYTEELEIPADYTNEEVEALVKRREDEVDLGNFTQDDFWYEQGDSTWQEVEEEGHE